MTGTQGSRTTPRRRRWKGGGASVVIVVGAAAFVAFRVASGAFDFTNSRDGHTEVVSLLLDAGATLAALAIAIGVPAWILWRRGQRRNAVIMERRPGALLLAGTRVASTVESARRLGAEARLRPWFGCAANEQGISIWQGVAPGRPVLSLPSSDIVAVQCLVLNTGRRTFQAISLVVDAGGSADSFTFLMRKPRRPLLPLRGHEAEFLVSQIQARLLQRTDVADDE